MVSMDDFIKIDLVINYGACANAPVDSNFLCGDSLHRNDFGAILHAKPTRRSYV